MTFVILIYLILGGFKAVVKTDILQYGAIIIILLMLTFLTFKGSLIPTSEWNFFAADIKTIVGFFLVGTAYPFAAPDLWQRVYAAKGRKQLKHGLLLSIMVYIFMAFLFALVALTVKVNFPGIDPDTALIHGFANLLPPGMIGLSVIFLFAAIMSTLDTYIFTGSSVIVQDFFKWGKQTIVRNMRKVIFLFTVLVTATSILVENLVVSAYIFIAFVCALAVPTIATWIKKEIKKETIVMSFIFALTGGITAIILFISSNPPLLVLITIVAAILGLFIGGLVSWLKKK